MILQTLQIPNAKLEKVNIGECTIESIISAKAERQWYSQAVESVEVCVGRCCESVIHLYGMARVERAIVVKKEGGKAE